MFSSFSNTFSILAIVLIFGGSIFIHELGHFLVAKARGLKVTRFSIGFGPKIFGWTGKDGCQYRVSLLPLGGYVAIPQLSEMDEIEGKDLSKEEIAKLKPASVTDKILVSAAGAFFNVLLAVAIALVIYFIGIPVAKESKTNIIGYVGENTAQAGTEATLQEGDVVLSIDSEKIENFNDIRMAIALGSNKDANGKRMALFKVLRDAKEIEVKSYPALIKTNKQTGDEVRMLDIYPASEMKVAKFMENSPAQKAGFKIGDEVIKIDGKRVYSLYRFREELNKAEGAVNITLLRDGKEVEVLLEPKKIPATKALCEIFEADSEKAMLNLICVNPNSKDISAELKGELKVLATNEYLADDIKIGATLAEIDNQKVDSLAALNTFINARAEEESLNLKFVDSSSKSTSILLKKGAKSNIVPPQELALAGYYLEQNMVTDYPSVGKQISDSFSVTFKAIKTLFNTNSDIGIDHMSGPVGISRVIYKISKLDIALLLSFTVLLNINLAILNMLPIPILDGGHIAMALIEKITGKAIQKSKAIKITQSIFALAFITLMFYIIYMDAQRWRGDINEEDIISMQKEYYLTDLNFENDE